MTQAILGQQDIILNLVPFSCNWIIARTFMSWTYRVRVLSYPRERSLFRAFFTMQNLMLLSFHRVKSYRKFMCTGAANTMCLEVLPFVVGSGHVALCGMCRGNDRKLFLAAHINLLHHLLMPFASLIPRNLHKALSILASYCPFYHLMASVGEKP